MEESPNDVLRKLIKEIKRLKKKYKLRISDVEVLKLLAMRNIDLQYCEDKDIEALSDLIDDFGRD